MLACSASLHQGLIAVGLAHGGNPPAHPGAWAREGTGDGAGPAAPPDRCRRRGHGRGRPEPRHHLFRLVPHRPAAQAAGGRPGLEPHRLPLHAAGRAGAAADRPRPADAVRRALWRPRPADPALSADRGGAAGKPGGLARPQHARLDDPDGAFGRRRDGPGLRDQAHRIAASSIKFFWESPGRRPPA